MLGGGASRDVSNSSGSIRSLKSPGKIEMDNREGAESMAVVYIRINASWMADVEDIIHALTK